MVKNIKIIALVAFLSMNQAYTADKPINESLATSMAGFLAGSHLSMEYAYKTATNKSLFSSKSLGFAKGLLAGSLGCALVADLTGSHKPNCTKHLIVDVGSGTMYGYPAVSAIRYLSGLKYGLIAMTVGPTLAGLSFATPTNIVLEKVLCDTDQEPLK